MKFIFEVPVYCGAMKVWRVLNLNSGTVYSFDCETEEEAFKTIEDGKKRAGLIVKALRVHQIAAYLETLGLDSKRTT